MKRSIGSLLRFRFLGTIAICVLVLSLYEHRKALAAFRTYQQWADPMVTRLAVMGRLIGAPLHDLPLVDLAGRPRSLAEETAGGVVWFIKVGECPACLTQELARWHGLVGTMELTGHVVFVGAPLEEARVLASGAGVRTPVLVDTAGTAVDAFGLRAPSVSIVTSRDGVILIADARFAGTASRCGWSFFEQLRAVYGRGDSRRIRVLSG